MSLYENITSFSSGHFSLVVFKILFKKQLAKKERGHFLSGVCRSAAITDNGRREAQCWLCILLCSIVLTWPNCRASGGILLSAVKHCVHLGRFVKV